MYRTIDASFWTDPRVRKLSADGKLLFLYLTTNAHTHVSGIYYLPRVTVKHEIGLSNRVLYTLSHTLSDAGLCKFDEELELVWVVNMFKYQGRGEKNHLAAAAHLSKDLHNSFLVKEFLQRYPEVGKLYKAPNQMGYRYPIDRVSDARTPEQEQNQKQEQKPSAPDKPGNGVVPARKRDLLFDAVADVTGSDPTLNGSRIGKLCSDLRKVEPPYTPEEVYRLAEMWATKKLTFRITVESIRKFIGWTRAGPEVADDFLRGIRSWVADEGGAK
jgi:hypothetical protein